MGPPDRSGAPQAPSAADRGALMGGCEYAAVPERRQHPPDRVTEPRPHGPGCRIKSEERGTHDLKACPALGAPSASPRLTAEVPRADAVVAPETSRTVESQSFARKRGEPRLGVRPFWARLRLRGPGPAKFAGAGEVRGVNELKPCKEWLAEFEDAPERASPRAPWWSSRRCSARFGELVPGSDRDWHLRFLITRGGLDHLFFDVEVGQAPVQPLR
jgi:hypothetical protein